MDNEPTVGGGELSGATGPECEDAGLEVARPVGIEFPRAAFPGTELVDTELVDTELVDTELVGTELVDTELVDTELVDTELIDRIEEELADVERALVRLDDGTYGRCEVCDASLSDAELAAAPAGRFCRSHLPLSLA